MANREAPKTCPKCGSGYLNIRDAGDDDGSTETIWGEIGCLSCGHTWFIEQTVSCETRDGEGNPSPLEGWDFDLGSTSETDWCPECGCEEVEALGRVQDGLLVVVAACPVCDWSGFRRRYYLGKAYLAD